MSDTSPNDEPADAGASASAVSTTLRPARARFRLPEEIDVIRRAAGIRGVCRRLQTAVHQSKKSGRAVRRHSLLRHDYGGHGVLLAIREVDRSVGWMFNFSAVIAATLMISGTEPWIAALSGVLFGALLGCSTAFFL